MSDATARLPWHRGGRQTSYIYDAGGKVVAESAGLEFVALIVKAVNAHDSLVEALHQTVAAMWSDDSAEKGRAAVLARAALDEAKP